MDLNELANEVTRREGKKISISVAQVKEVIRCLCDVVREMSFRQRLMMVGRLFF